MPTGLGLALMQLAGACSYLSDCMSLISPSPLAMRALLLARLVVKADERSSGSIEGKADAGRLATIGAPAACCCASFACTACTTCREELMT